jgi:hypothetical protein
MEAHKIMKRVKIFPLFKDMCFSLPRPLPVTVLNFAKQDARYRVLLTHKLFGPYRKL